MSGTVLLVLGLLLLLLGIADFLFTTLSSNGAGYFSKRIYLLTNLCTQALAQIIGRKAYRYSILFINLSLLLAWLMVLWIGLFLVFSSNPEAVQNSSGKVANLWERLYFSGFTLSTLGIGDFTPRTPFFQLVTTLFSFFGFFFFTASISYFISISSGVVNKRVLARSIRKFGRSPKAIAQYFTAVDPSFMYNQFIVLQELIDTHIVNQNARTALHFSFHSDPDVSLGLNLVRLDEALNLLYTSDEGKELHQELRPLRDTLTVFLQELARGFPRELNNTSTPALPEDTDTIGGFNKEQLEERRKILKRLLRSEGYDWEDVTG